MSDKLYTIPEAAKIAGVNERNLRRAAQLGALPTEKLNRIYMVKLRDVEQWRDNPDAHRPGRRSG